MQSSNNNRINSTNQTAAAIRQNDVCTVTCGNNNSKAEHSSCATDNNNNNNNSPSSYIRSLFLTAGSDTSRKRKRMMDAEMKACLSVPDEQHLDAYSMDIVRATRDNDIVAMRGLLLAGRTFDACNRNGESLLHLACRRGNVATIEFLVKEATVQVDAADCMGRTVLHDVCWRTVPDYTIVLVLLQHLSPTILVQQDVRGHTCFEYCRKEHYTEWVAFLQSQSKALLHRLRLFDLVNQNDNNNDDDDE